MRFQPDANVILFPRKHTGFDNQLWEYDIGFLVNKGSGLVLEVPGYGKKVDPLCVYIAPFSEFSQFHRDRRQNSTRDAFGAGQSKGEASQP